MNNTTSKTQQSQANTLELYCVYLHTHTISGKGYVGQTVEGMHKRFNKHVSDANIGSDSHFHRAIRKYGVDAFTSHILYVSFERDSDHLKEVEIQLIVDYDTFYNGYNSTTGGDGVGSGKDHPRFGVEVSLETRNKQSAAMKGNKNGLGYKFTPKQCTNVSSALLGNKYALGYKHTPEQNAKHSAAMSGSNNPAYDDTTHTFIHTDGTIFTGEQYDLRVKYELRSSDLSNVIHGNRKTVRGWQLYDKPKY